jgi:beta-glucosidase
MTMQMKFIIAATCLCILLPAFSVIEQLSRDDAAMIAARRKNERSTNDAIERKIDDLLSKMTLEEKIGQMTQINNSEIVTNAQWGAGADLSIETKVDTAKLGKMLRKYHVGSFLNGIAESPQVWYQFYKDIQEKNMQVSRLKIPVVYGIDHMHGPNYIDGATIFPHAINTACTFNNQMLINMAHVTAVEAADVGHQWIFGPVCDVSRTPLWGRYYETLGESPYQVATMASIYTKAIESEKDIAPYKIAASAKHFLGYSDPKSGWDRTPAEISDQTLYEIFVPPFRAAINAGIKTVMINSGEINGEPVHSSYRLLTQLLRDELKFKGVAVTDWEDIIRLYKNHKTATDEKDATYQAINAGVDMAMTPYTTTFCDLLKDLVKEGKISMERIDLSVSRVLRMKFEMGLFENPYPRNDRFKKIGSPEHKALALEAARESIVMLKNDNTLPLAPEKTKSIVVAGPVANSKVALAGGWTLRWIPTEEKIYPKDMLTVYSALQKEFSKSSVTLAANADDIKSKSSTADAIVIAVGEMAYSEGFGSIHDLDLPQDQVDLVKAAQSTGKPVILVVVAGRPRVITNIFSNSKAVLFAGWPGFEGAQAIAEIISGKVNPSGKLAFNYPVASNRIVPHNHKQSEVLLAHQIDNPIALVPFGSGLGYSNFEYTDLKLSDSTITTAGSLTATVTVKNNGSREGKESVLWFLQDEVGSISRPVRDLKYYEKQSLKPGESKSFTFIIKPEEQLAFPDKTGKMLLEDGYFTIMVGKLKSRFKLQGSNSVN